MKKMLFLLIFLHIMQNCAFSASDKCPWPILSSIYQQADSEDNETKDRDFWWEPAGDDWWWMSSDCKSWYCRPHSDFYLDERKKKKKDPCKIPALDFLDVNALKSLPAPLFRELINELKDYSVSYPTPANVQKYMKVQYLAMARAKKYQEVWSEALWRHPSLDYTVVRPTSLYASKVGAVSESQIIERFLKSLGNRDDVAVVGMISPGCIYCAQIGPILARFKRDYNITLRLINIQAHPEVAVKFGIESVPEVWLAVRDVGTMRAAAGLRTYNVLKKAIVRAWERLTGQTVLPQKWEKKSPIDMKLDINNPQNQYFIERSMP